MPSSTVNLHNANQNHTNTTNNTTNNATNKTASNKVSTQPSETIDKKTPTHEMVAKSKNAAIVDAHLNVSLKGNNEAMSLLYKTALEEINKALEPALGKQAIQKAYESNIDVSPEATAKRIVDGATGFYAAFAQQNPELSGEELYTSFLDVISGGIDKGFEEARDILDSLSVLDGDIATNIDLTYDLVKAGLTKFAEQLRTPKEELISEEELPTEPQVESTN